MDLQEFVKESLSQIFKGLKEVQDIASATGAEISPMRSGGVVSFPLAKNSRLIQEIEFDVAVTTTDGSDVKGGISVMGIGIKGELNESSSTVSRIKFKVPVVLPST